MAVSRLGMLGGSFNPVHCGHVSAALFARDTLELDLMLLMPVARPPHKELAAGADPEQRVEMLRLAFEGQPRVEVSRLELDRQGPSYSVDTARQLHGLYHPQTLFLVMGTDMFLTLEEWRDYRTLLTLCVPVVFLRREGEARAVKAHAARLQELYRAPSRLLPMPPVEVSSTALREKLRGGQEVRGLLPQSVEDYIRENGLYR